MSDEPVYQTRLFVSGVYNPHARLYCEHLDVASRLQRVRQCNDIDVLREALARVGLQQTVRTAIESRIRRLQRQAATHQEAQP